jgi:hypothetical protein
MDDELRIGIQLIVNEAVQATPADEILLIFDESAERFIPFFIAEAIRNSLSVTCLYIPLDYQRFLSKKMIVDRDMIWLPTVVKSGIITASIIINVLGGHGDTLPVRRAVLDVPRKRESRFAHVPGLSEEVIRTVAQTDFKEIVERCELLGWFLGNGQTFCLETYDASGHSYTLNATLGGWDNEPLLSPGLILPGSWGNLPPGEVFCLPEMGSAEGEVCINGSIPSMAFMPDEYIVLVFERGRLVSWRSPNSPRASGFFSEQQSRALINRDGNWNCLTELGIGLNPSVASLTGNALFDEKAAGTVHIAIGANDVFGGPIVADIHHDLVTWKPSLQVDNVMLLKRGELLLAQLKDYRRKWQFSPTEFSAQQLEMKVMIKESDTYQENGTIYRRLCRAGRVGHVVMAEGQKSGPLDKLIEFLREHRSIRLHDLLESFPVFDGADTKELLGQLNHFRCIILTNQ